MGILALVPDDWWDARQRRHQILTRLAQRWPVAWVSPPPHWRAWLFSQPTTSMQAPPAPGMFVQDERSGMPTVYAPRAFAHAILRQRVKRAERWLREQGCRRIELEIWRPEFAPALDWVSATTTTYHIDDEYSWSDTPQPMSANERALIARVDRVFVTSPTLLEQKGGINPRTLYSSNGVSFTSFSAPRPEPTDLATIPHPRLAFVGVLRRGIDWELLSALAKRNPRWSFVFVGAVREGHGTDRAPIDALSQLPNVHLLGERNADDLPGYLQHVDVSLLPYRTVAYMNAINPMKMYESLATGTPVVGASIPTIVAQNPVVSTAASVEEWEVAITNALSPTARSAAQRMQRQSVAQQHDWDAIASAIGDEIAPSLR
jgi:glycosyltransferase involved in cell wall biosynthesis